MRHLIFISHLYNAELSEVGTGSS